MAWTIMPELPLIGDPEPLHQLAISYLQAIEIK
jgi:hypothetical protein